MSLNGIYDLLEKAINVLNEDSPSVSSLTLQEKLYYVNLHFTYLKQGFDEELSNYQDDLYPQEVTDLYIEIKALMKNLDIDKRSDPQRPSMLVNDDKAQTIKAKMIRLHSLIEAKINTVDSLYDSYSADE